MLGWTFQTIHTGASDYAVALVDGRPIGGLFQKSIPAGEHRQSERRLGPSDHSVAVQEFERDGFHLGRTIIAGNDRRNDHIASVVESNRERRIPFCGEARK